MRAWRAQHARERAGVTDQGFERRGAESKVAIAEVSDAIEVEKVQRRSSAGVHRVWLEDPDGALAPEPCDAPATVTADAGR